MDELIQLAEGLRRFYPADNRVGLLLDELVKDLKAGAPRKEVLGDVEAVKAELDPRATAHGVIDQITAALKSAKKPSKRKPSRPAPPPTG